jgi:hypothetical protein
MNQQEEKNLSGIGEKRRFSQESSVDSTGAVDKTSGGGKS